MSAKKPRPAKPNHTPDKRQPGADHTGSPAVAKATGTKPAPPAPAEPPPSPAPLVQPADTADPATGMPVEQIGTRRGMFGGGGNTSGYGGLIRPVTLPPAATQPFGGYFDDVYTNLVSALRSDAPAAAAIEKVVIDRGEMTIFVDRQHILAVCQALRDDPSLRFEQCASLSGVHYPQDEGRELHVVYQLRSLTHQRQLRLEVACPDADPHVPSVVSVYPAANWQERETWDFFGVIFDGHPSLTRIEMPDDWIGHPQRKDYPLGGVNVEYKGAVIPPPDRRRG